MSDQAAVQKIEQAGAAQWAALVAVTPEVALNYIVAND
jgi:hypothetical protein